MEIIISFLTIKCLEESLDGKENRENVQTWQK